MPRYLRKPNLASLKIRGFRSGTNYNVWVTPGIAFFFACLNIGSIQLPMMLHLDSSLSGIIQGTLVLAVLLMQVWQKRRQTVNH